MAPFGTDKNNSITSFSNLGPEIDLAAPGDRIISTFPAGLRGARRQVDGCLPGPAVGSAARMLAGQATILALPCDRARSDAMAKFVLQKAKSLGFPAELQAQGMLYGMATCGRSILHGPDTPKRIKRRAR